MDFTVGGILSETFAAVRDRIAPLIGMWLIYLAVTIALFIVLSIAIGFTAVTGMALEDPTAMGGGMILSLLLFYVGYILIYMAQTGALVALASPVRDLSFGDAFFAGVKSSPTLLATTILLLVAYFLVSIPLGLLVAAIAMGSSALSQVLAILMIPVIVYVGSRLTLVVPLAAVTGIGNPVRVITESWRLTRGKVLTIFLALLLFAIIAALVFAAAITPVFGVVMSGNVGDAASIGLVLYMFLAFVGLGVLMAIFQAALMAVLHAKIAGSTEMDLGETFA